MSHRQAIGTLSVRFCLLPEEIRCLGTNQNANIYKMDRECHDPREENWNALWCFYTGRDRDLGLD